MIEETTIKQSHTLLNTYENSSEIKLSRGDVLNFLEIVSNPLNKDYAIAEYSLHSHYKQVISKIDFNYLKSLRQEDNSIFLTDHEIEFLNYIDKWDTSNIDFPKFMILKKGLNIQEVLIKLYKNNFIQIVDMVDAFDLATNQELDYVSQIHEIDSELSKDLFLDSISSELSLHDVDNFFEKELIVLTDKAKSFIEQYYNVKISSKNKNICNQIEILQVVLNCNYKKLDIKESKKILDKLIYLNNIIDNKRGLINYSIQYFTISILENDINIYIAKSQGVSDETIDFLYGHNEHQISFSPKYTNLLRDFLNDGLMSIQDVLTAVYYYSDHLPVEINDIVLSRKIINILK